MKTVTLVSRRRSSSERMSLGIAFASMVVGLVGCMVASISIYPNFILLFAFVEVTTVAMFFILALSFIPAYFPDKMNVESIYYSGLGKEPYIRNDEVYRPNVPLINTQYDNDWDEYYDKKAIKVDKA